MSHLDNDLWDKVGSRVSLKTVQKGGINQLVAVANDGKEFVIDDQVGIRQRRARDWEIFNPTVCTQEPIVSVGETYELFVPGGFGNKISVSVKIGNIFSARIDKKLWKKMKKRLQKKMKKRHAEYIFSSNCIIEAVDENGKTYLLSRGTCGGWVCGGKTFARLDVSGKFAKVIEDIHNG